MSSRGRGATIRILVVSHTLHAWGAEQRILDTARRLANEGFAMSLAAPSAGSLAAQWASAGLSLVPFTSNPREGLRRPDDSRPSPAELAHEASATMANARNLARLANGFDILHSHSLSANLDVSLAALWARRRSVLDVHDIVRPGLGRLVLTAGSLLADATIVNSRATKATIVAPVRHLTVILPGVDTEVFRPGGPDPTLRAELAEAPADPIIGIVGRMDPEKGISVLVEAVHRLNTAGRRVNLVVVGAPTRTTLAWSQAMQEEAATVLGSRVRFIGARADVPEILRSIDVMVNASDCEPFGRSVLEAQASGTPVVASDTGGIPEFVDDGRTGLLVPPRDPARLASAIGRLLDDPDLARRLAADAQESATKGHSAAGHAAAVGELYKQIARRASTRARSR